MHATKEATLETKLQNMITDELMKAAGLAASHWTRPLVNVIVNKSTRTFARFCAQLDEDLVSSTFSAAVRKFTGHFVSSCTYDGVETIPQDGPLLVTANHPGATDALVILSMMQREDIKIVLSGVPFTSALPNAQNHFIHVPSHPHDRSIVIRNIISHLRSHGCVFIFPTGHVTPDPEWVQDPNLILQDWSPSVAFVLEKVQQTQLVLTIVSGVTEKRFLHSPLVKFRKTEWRQQILAEFLQILTMLVRKNPSPLIPRVTFMPPYTAGELVGRLTGDAKEIKQVLHNTVLELGKSALEKHFSNQNKMKYEVFNNLS